MSQFICFPHFFYITHMCMVRCENGGNPPPPPSPNMWWKMKMKKMLPTNHINFKNRRNLSHRFDNLLYQNIHWVIFISVFQTKVRQQNERSRSSTAKAIIVSQRYLYGKYLQTDGTKEQLAQLTNEQSISSLKDIARTSRSFVCARTVHANVRGCLFLYACRGVACIIRDVIYHLCWLFIIPATNKLYYCWEFSMALNCTKLFILCMTSWWIDFKMGTTSISVVKDESHLKISFTEAHWLKKSHCKNQQQSFRISVDHTAMILLGSHLLWFQLTGN